MENAPHGSSGVLKTAVRQSTLAPTAGQHFYGHPATMFCLQAAHCRRSAAPPHTRTHKTLSHLQLILPVVSCGCETWSLTLREEYRLRVFGNKAQRRMFGWGYKGVSDRAEETTAL